MSHIIGRPDDGLLDVLLGPGTDPEHSLIHGDEPGEEESAVDDPPPGDEPPVPER